MFAHALSAIFAFSRSRSFKLTLLAFQFLWLNVVVPGHRRGIVALPGASCTQCATEMPPAKPCCQHGEKKQPAAPSDPASHCAICFFAARVSMPVVYDFTHPPLLESGQIEPPARLIVHVPDVAFTYLGRGPPIAC